MSDLSAQPVRADTLDSVAADLKALRESVGMSYRGLAAAITAQRQAEGRTPAAAQIAHTTVADAFRTGRARINIDLVVEIVRALGGDGEEWRQRCVQAMRVRSEQTAQREADAAVGGADARAVESGAPDAVASGASGAVESGAAGRAASDLGSSGLASADPASDRGALVAHVRRPGTVAMVVIGALLLNAVGKFFNPLLGDLFFFDMVGTAVAALLLGPWWAALVGVLFVAVELLKGDVGGALFAMTMITAGLVWGYGVRFGLGRTLPKFIGLSAVVAAVTTAIAVPVTVLYYGGNPGRGYEGIFAWATELMDVWAVVGVTNLLVSVADKVLVGVTAFFLARAVAAAQRSPAVAA